MRNIKTDEGFGILFKHDYSIRDVISGCGCVASRIWESVAMKPALNLLFGTHKGGLNEGCEITAIEITRDGIKAHFERIPDAVLETPKIQRRKARRKK